MLCAPGLLAFVRMRLNCLCAESAIEGCQYVCLICTKNELMLVKLARSCEDKTDNIFSSSAAEDKSQICLTRHKTCRLHDSVKTRRTFRFDSRRSRRFMSLLPVVLAQPHIEWVPENLRFGLNRPESEATHSSPSATDVCDTGTAKRRVNTLEPAVNRALYSSTPLRPSARNARLITTLLAHQMRIAFAAQITLEL